MRLQQLHSLLRTSSIVLVANLELDSRQDGNDDGKHNTHGVAVAVAVQLERGVVDVVHDGIGAVVGAAGRQQLDQRKALERVDGGEREGRLSASDFISHRFKIEQINEALEAVKRNEVIKTVLTF